MENTEDTKTTFAELFNNTLPKTFPFSYMQKLKVSRGEDWGIFRWSFNFVDEILNNYEVSDIGQTYDIEVEYVFPLPKSYIFHKATIKDKIVCEKLCSGESRAYKVLRTMLSTQIVNSEYFSEYDLMVANPKLNVAKGKEDEVYINVNPKANPPKRQSIKIGKAIRKFFGADNITDVEVENLVNTWKAEFSTPVQEVKESDTDFAEIYSMGYDKQQQFTTTDDEKYLSDSCMQREFSEFDYHPCEAYNSGDFTIIYTTTTKDVDGGTFLTGRMMVYNSPEGPRLAPIYATNEEAIELIQKRVREKYGNFYDTFSRGWSGARFLKIHHQGKQDEFIAPYQDCGNGLSVYDETFLVSHYTDYSMENTHEVVYYEMESCDCCGSDFSSSSIQTLHDGDRVCNHCLDAEYVFTEDTERYVRTVDTFYVLDDYNTYIYFEDNDGIVWCKDQEDWVTTEWCDKNGYDHDGKKIVEEEV